MKCLPTFLFQNIKAYDPLIGNFRVWVKIYIEIILASHHCDLCNFSGMHDFG